MITEAMVEEREIPNPARQLEDVVLRLRNDHLDAKLSELMARLGDVSLAESEKAKILEARAKLTLIKRTPLSPSSG